MQGPDAAHLQAALFCAGASRLGHHTRTMTSLPVGRLVGSSCSSENRRLDPQAGELRSCSSLASNYFSEPIDLMFVFEINAFMLGSQVCWARLGTHRVQLYPAVSRCSALGCFLGLVVEDAFLVANMSGWKFQLAFWMMHQDTCSSGFVASGSGSGAGEFVASTDMLIPNDIKPVLYTFLCV